MKTKKIKIRLCRICLNPLRSGLGFNPQVSGQRYSSDYGFGLNPLRSGLGFNIDAEKYVKLSAVTKSQSPQIGSWFQFKFFI